MAKVFMACSPKIEFLGAYCEDPLRVHPAGGLLPDLDIARSGRESLMPRHRHQEWLRFLKKIDKETPKDKDLHLIVDNYATHRSPPVRAWLAKHPRFHIHFTPTSASWLNMVERFFRNLTTKRLRRGVFRNVPELIASIEEHLAHHNESPTPYV